MIHGRTQEDEERTRKRMLEAEAIALLLLLRRRRQLAPNDIPPSKANAIASALQSYLYQDILGIREAARIKGLADMQLQFTGAPGIRLRGIEIPDRIYDLKRAQRYSENVSRLVQLKAGAPDAIRILDNRLATIGISENSEAFNRQRLIVAEAIAEKYDLVEVWDAMNDRGTCDNCWRMNGDRAVVGRGFVGGLRPGAVHARCRCTSHFERVTYH